MTGRVLTQPELCELPPSVLLLPPSLSRSPSLLTLFVSRRTFPRRRACFSSLLEEESFGIHLSDSRVTRTRQIRTTMIFFPL